MLVAGGEYKDGGWKSILSRSTSEIYNVDRNTWTSTGDLKQGRRKGVMVATGNDVYFIGGAVGWNSLDSVEKFNMVTRTWEMTKIKLKKGLESFSAVSVNRNVFC